MAQDEDPFADLPDVEEDSTPTAVADDPFADIPDEPGRLAKGIDAAATVLEKVGVAGPRRALDQRAGRASGIGMAGDVRAGALKSENEASQPAAPVAPREPPPANPLEQGIRTGVAMIKSTPNTLDLAAAANRYKSAEAELGRIAGPGPTGAAGPASLLKDINTEQAGGAEARAKELAAQMGQDKAVVNEALQIWRQYQEEQKAAGKGVPEFTDVAMGEGDFATWLKYNLGQGGAIMVPLILASAIPTVGPALGAAGAAALNYGDVQSQRLEENQPHYGQPGVGRPSAIEAGMRAAEATIEKVNAESTAVAVTAVGYTALDFALGPVGRAITGKMGREAASEMLATLSKSAAAKEVLKAFGFQTLEEGINEGGQEFLSVLMEKALDGKDIVTADTAKRLINAAAAGAASGGPMGAAQRAGEIGVAKVRAGSAGEPPAGGRIEPVPLNGDFVSVKDQFVPVEGGFQAPNGAIVTPEQWDNASERVRAGWMQSEEAPTVPRGTPPDGGDGGGGARVYDKVDNEGRRYRTFVSGGVVDDSMEKLDPFNPDRVYPTVEVAEGEDVAPAAAPPEETRATELRRLADQAQDEAVRADLLKRALAEEEAVARVDTGLKQADELDRLAADSSDPSVAEELQARAAKLRAAVRPKATGIQVAETTLDEAVGQQAGAKPAAEGIAAEELEVEDAGTIEEVDPFSEQGADYVPLDRRRDPERRRAVAQLTPEEMRKELLTSPGTSLPNKRAWDESEPPAHVTNVDVDSLKWINDTLGHEAGDELLAKVGAAFRAVAGDKAFHISGDEFRLAGATRAEAESALRKVNALLKKETITATLPDGTVITKRGIGLSYGHGSNINEAETNLQADKANRTAKGLRPERGAEPAGVDRAAPGTGRAPGSPGNGQSAGVPGRAGRGKAQPAEIDRLSKSPLLQKIADAGGIDKAEKSELNLDSKDARGRRVSFSMGGRRGELFRTKGGLAEDQLVEWLEQHGYITESQIADLDKEAVGGSVGWARELLRQEIQNPGSVVPLAGADAQAEAQAARQRRFDLEDEARKLGLDAALPDDQLERAVLDKMETDWLARSGITMDGAQKAKLISYAATVDEDAVERAAVQFEDDEPAFMRAIQDIIDGHGQATDGGRQGDDSSAAPQVSERNAGDQGSQDPQAREAGGQAAGDTQQGPGAGEGRPNAEGRRPQQQPGLDGDAAARAPRRVDRDSYTTDLFGAPLSEAPRNGVDAGVAVAFRTPVDSPPPGALPPGSTALTEVVTRRIGRLKVPAEPITSNARAAQAFAHLRRMPREYLDALIVDKSNTPIAHWRGFMGAQSQTSVYPAELAKFAASVPNAAGIWIAHNHPSGLAEPSRADEMLTMNIERLFRGVMPLRGHVVIAGTNYAGLGTEFGNAERGPIAPTLREREVPILERVVLRSNPGDPVNSPEKAKAAVKSDLGGKAGFIFVDTQNRFIGAVPYDLATPRALRGTGEAKALMAMVARLNPGAVILSTGQPGVAIGDATANIAGLFKQLDVRPLDAVSSDGKSYAEAGMDNWPPDFAAKVWFSPLASALEASKTEKAPASQWIGTIKGLKGISPSELEWSGVLDWLATQGDRKVPRAEVVNFVAENGVTLTEVTHGTGNEDVREAQARERAALRQELRDWFHERWPTWTIDQQNVVVAELEGSRWTGPQLNAEQAAYINDWAQRFHMTATATRVNELTVRLTALGYTPEFDYGTGELMGVTHTRSGTNYFYQNELAGWHDGGDGGFEQPKALDPAVAQVATELGDATRAAFNADGDENEARYQDYTLPGGTNYREILITLPTTPSPEGLAKRKAVFDKWKLQIEVARRKYVDLQGGRSLQYGDIRKAETELHELEQQRDNEANAAYTLPEDNAYRGPHWNEANIVAHLRTTDRTDADGKRVLFIEEVQSDWAQKGRKSGFAPPRPADRAALPPGVVIEERRVKGIAETFFDPVWTPESGRAGAAGRPGSSRQQAVDNAWHEIDRGVPRAPFVERTDAWAALALKRAIKYAADNGYDRVAWTTGKQQADRYNLANHVSRLAYYDNSTGGIGRPRLDGPPSDGMLVAHDLRGRPVIERRVSPAELPDIIGKEAADRLLNAEAVHSTYAGLGARKRALEGLDLQIGGEGMLEFYDRMVPKLANDILKKLGGGKAGKVRIPIAEGNPFRLRVVSDGDQYWVAGESPNSNIGNDQPLSEKFKTYEEAANARTDLMGGIKTQPGFDITPELRASVAQGMPLFKRQDEAKPRAPMPQGVLPHPQPPAPVTPAQLRQRRAEVRVALDMAYGRPLISALIKRGILRLETADENPSRLSVNPDVRAVYSEQDPRGPGGGASIFYDRIDPRDAPRLLAHEVGEHFGLIRMLGADAYYKLLAQVDAAHARGDPEINAAWEYVKFAYTEDDGSLMYPEGSDPFVREVAAVVIEQAPYRGWVREVLDAVRAWLYRTFGEVPFLGVDANLLRGLASAALRSAALGELPRVRKRTQPVAAARAPADRFGAAIRKAWEGYDGSGNLTLNDLADEVDAALQTLGDDARLTAALDAFRAEQRDDMALAGRGDMDAAGERFTAAVRAYLDAPAAAIARTPAFRAWFGKSKVVDADGRPMVVYHGTAADFEAFDPEAAGKTYGIRGGIFFSSSPEVASNVALDAQGGAPNVRPAYLSIKRPYVVKALARHEDAAAAFDDAADEIVAAAKAGNHDGVIVRHADDAMFIAFRPEQIRSATAPDAPAIVRAPALDALNENQMAAVERRFAAMGPDGARLRANLSDPALATTAWAKQTVDGMLVRAAIDEYVAGRTPDFGSPLDQPHGETMRKRLARGRDAVWGYLAEVGLVGDASKPVNNVNSSFANCEPSPACATYCYATRGNYPQFNPVVKSELTNWAVEDNPRRAAAIIARNYKSKAEFEAGKALRLFDKGDGNAAWLPVIKHLNDAGIRTQIFSKRPEFLRQVSPYNVRLLSIDSTNYELARANPDLPVAFIYTDSSQIAFLEEIKDRVQVILPVKLGQRLLTSDEVDALPRWTKVYQCPIDNGTKRLPAVKGGDGWVCTKCDKNAGIGCFRGQATQPVLKAAATPPSPGAKLDAAAKEIRDVIDRSIPEGQREDAARILDGLMAAIRAGVDVTSEGTGAQGDAGGRGVATVSISRLFPGRGRQSDLGLDRPEAGSDEVARFESEGGRLPPDMAARVPRAPKSPTDTPAFKAWFGKSKVVDADGKPLRVYHGTDAEDNFTAFDTDMGSWFAERPGTANTYAQKGHGGDPRLVPAYLSIQRPFIIPKEIDLSQDTDLGYALEVLNKANGTKLTPAMWKTDGDASGTAFQFFSDDILADEIRKLGFDGLHAFELGEPTWMVLNPGQVKGAFNRGTFDRNDPDTLAARGPRSRAMPQPPVDSSNLDAEDTIGWLTRKFFDRFNRVREMQRRIPGIADDMNVVQADTLYYGRAQFAGEELEQKFIEPLGEALKQAKTMGITVRDADDFLMAMHAPERNRVIAARNPAMPDGGSGLTNSQAGAILQSFNLAQRAALDRIASIVYAMNDDKLRRLETGGLITPLLAQTLRTQYQHYVPLKTLDDEDAANGVGRGYEIRNPGVEMAFGRQSKAGSPIAASLMDAARSVVLAEKAKVDQVLWNLAQDSRVQDVIVPMDDVRAAREFSRQRFNKDTRQVETIVDTNWKNREDVMKLRVAGEEQYLWVRDDLLRDQLRKVATLNDPGPVLRALGTVTGSIGRLLTEFNPAFTLPNAVRDALSGFVRARAIDRVRPRAVLAGIPAAWKMIVDFKRDANTPGAAMYREFQEDGGKTGAYGITDLADTMHELERLGAELGYADQGRGPGDKVWHAVKAVGKWVSHGNEVIEYATRLSLYREARNQGYTRKQAALWAKELTVNFNRSGEYGRTMNSVFVFANAALQGLYGTIMFGKSHKVRMAMLGLVMIGAATQAWNEAGGGDDEETDEKNVNTLSDFQLDHNIVVLAPGSSRGAKIPLPPEYAFLYATGRRLWRAMSQGNVKKEAAGIAGAFLGSTLPVRAPDASSIPVSGIKALTPTAVLPFVDVAINENFMGAPIVAEQRNRFAPQPYTTLARRYTSDVAKTAAELVNTATGGDRIEPGLAQDALGPFVSPEAMEHIVGYYTGGLGQFVLQSTNMAKAVAGDPESLDLNRVPIVNRFVFKQPQGYVSRRYRELASQFQYALARDRTGEGVEQIKPEVRAALPLYQSAERDLRPLFAELRTAAEEGDKDRERNVQAQILAIQAGVVKTFNEARQRQ